MKPILTKAVVLVGLVALVVGAFWIGWPSTASSKTIIEMSQQGSSEKAMLTTVAESRPYRLSADEVIKLKTAGVPNNVIVAMLQDADKK